MDANVRRMGFLPGNTDDKRAESRVVGENEVFLRFDSGRVITLGDATHHVLTYGSTGSGKSQSVFYPALLNLLKAGAFGLIIDIKGNMRSKVRALAETCGRAGDLLELGSSDSATPLNINMGMDRHQMRQFFELITLDNFQGQSQSLDWHMKGVSAAADCGQLLLFLREKYPNFDLNCRLIYEMISEPVEAQKLYAFFRKTVFDPARPDHASLVAAIDNNRFHVLKEIDRKRDDKNLDEQLTWILTGIRDGLRAFLDAPGIARNFCRPGAPGLELAEAMLAGKIVLVRFDPSTGRIGSRLARLILSHYYSRVFQLGLSLPKDKKGFVCIDEFQEVADLSANKGSDSSFIALAREFNCIFMAASQSQSSLLNSGENAAAVMSFASNCNQKIIFYSDDPMTRELAARYDPNLNLADLNPGEAFVATYDKDTRKHEYGLETLNNAWASVKDITDNGVSEPLPAMSETSLSPDAIMRGLVEWAEAKMKEEAAQNSDRGKKRDENAAAGNVEKRRVDDREEDGMKENEMTESARTLIEKFPDMFAGCDGDFCLPAGWMEYVENAFRAFQATGIQVKIKSLVFDEDGPSVFPESSRRRGYAFSILNNLLRGARCFCIICGKRLDEHDGSRDLPNVCPCCLQKYGLDVPESDDQDDDDEDSDSFADIHKLY